MMVFTFYLMKLPWLAGDEKFLIWGSSAVKFSFREVPSSEDFAFINTSYDLQLVDRFDEFGFPVGNRAITDREKLLRLFSAINNGEKKPKYIILDIHFVDSTEFDTALQKELNVLDNVIVSAHLNEKGELEKPIFNVNHGLSDYVIGSVFDGIYKYQLIYQDSLKQTPLKVFEALHGEPVTSYGPFVKIGERWTTNNFIMNYRILQKDIQNLEAGFNPVGMGELLYLPDEDIQDFLADKIVVVGDFFENDMHETIFEITSGPIILVNALLTIEEADTIVNLFFFSLMFIFYAYLSFLVYYEGDFIEKKIEKFTSKKMSRYFIGFASYFLILAVFSIICFIFFNIHVNIFFVAIGFYLLDRLVSIVYKIRSNTIGHG